MIFIHLMNFRVSPVLKLRSRQEKYQYIQTIDISNLGQNFMVMAIGS